MNILMTDLKAVYKNNELEIKQAIHTVLESGWYVLGKEVEKFEEDFARWINVPYAISVANGTDALELALRACEVGFGDYVATVSNTAVATVSAIERCGAIPILIDIDPSTMTLCPEHLETFIKQTQKTIKAVIPVHLYGHMVDMDSIMELARKYHFYVIEDCAQAHGALMNGKKAGGFGDLAAFSFYPTKNLGAFGDGGAIVTKNKEWSDKIRLLRQYGWKERNSSQVVGVNSRLDEMQAAILNVLLKKLDDFILKRQQIANLYSQVKGLDICHPTVKENFSHAYHLYVIKSKKRAELMSYFTDRGIQTAIHYPTPIHLQPAYQARYKVVNDLRGPLEVTEKNAQEILSLPLHPYLSNQQLDYIIDVMSL